MKASDLSIGAKIRGPSGSLYTVRAVNAGQNCKDLPDHVVASGHYPTDGAAGSQFTFDDIALEKFTYE